MAIWDRQKDETIKAYAGFCTYRELPIERRNLDSAWRVYKSIKEGSAKAPGYFRTWCIKNKWVERAEAFDEEKDRKSQESIIKEAAAAKARRIKLAQQLQMAGLQIVQSADLKTLKSKEARELMKVVRGIVAEGVKVEREEFGEASSITESRTELSGTVAVKEMTTDELDKQIAAKLAELEDKEKATTHE